MIIEVPTEVTLKPCPFCGSEAVLKMDRQPQLANDARLGKAPIALHYWVKCTKRDCGVSPAAQNAQSAVIDGWNRRA